MRPPLIGRMLPPELRAQFALPAGLPADREKHDGFVEYDQQFPPQNDDEVRATLVVVALASGRTILLVRIIDDDDRSVGKT